MIARQGTVLGIAIALACVTVAGCRSGSSNVPDAPAAAGSSSDDMSSDESAGGGGLFGGGAGGASGSASGGRGGEPPSDGGALEDASVPPSDGGRDLPTGEPSCAQWAEPLDAVNARDAARLGFYVADAVIEGTLGALEPLGDQPHANVRVTRVHHGWSFMAGSDMLVPMDAELHAELGEGGAVVLGLGTPAQRPMVSEVAPGRIVWPPLLAALRASDAAALGVLADYRAWKAKAGVAVMRVAGNDTARYQLELVETLAGTLTSTVQENWPAAWALPYPSVSSDEYLVSFSRLDTIGTVSDFRPNTPEERARIEAALARMDDDGSAEQRLLAELADGVEQATSLRTSWLYKTAEHVVRVEVKGITPKCCATLDRFYYLNEVLEAFAPADPLQQVVTLGEYGDDQCGERFIYPLYGVPTAPPEPSEAYVCDGSFNTTATPEIAYHTERMPDTAENAAAVRAWVDSAAPLYLLHPAARDLASTVPAAPSAGARWSAPLPADVALRMGHLIQIRIEAVVERAEGYEVELSTAFYPRPTPTDPDHRLKLYFQCGDARLLEVGASYLAVIARAEHSRYLTFEEYAEHGELYLVPGLLLPPRDVYRTLMDELNRPEE